MAKNHYDKIIDNYLKKGFKSHPKLCHNHQLKYLSERMKRLYCRGHTLFCIDVEAYEHDNTIINEIGICIYEPQHQKSALVPSFKTYHIIPEEAKRYTNGRYVPDHSTNFMGECTYIMKLGEATKFVQILIDNYFKNPKCCLIGHDLKGDVKWFQSLGLTFPDNVLKIDTQTLLHLLTSNRLSLTNSLKHVGIHHAFLHNAGNDAYYTLLLAMKLGDPSVRRLYNLDDYDSVGTKTFPKRKRPHDCEQVKILDALELIGMETESESSP